MANTRQGFIRDHIYAALRNVPELKIVPAYDPLAADLPASPPFVEYSFPFFSQEWTTDENGDTVRGTMQNKAYLCLVFGWTGDVSEHEQMLDRGYYYVDLVQDAIESYMSDTKPSALFFVHDTFGYQFFLQTVLVTNVNNAPQIQNNNVAAILFELEVQTEQRDIQRDESFT
jgi:hypothetical protein